MNPRPTLNLESSMRIPLLLVLVLFPLAAAAAQPGLPADSARVSGDVYVPETLDSFAGLTLQLQLWEYDPRADSPASLFDRLELGPAEHTRGRDSASPFVLGETAQGGKIRPGMRYYLTCFLIDGSRRTHIGEPEGERGICRVLTEGHPREVKLIIRPVP